MELAEGARSSRSAWKFAVGDLWREGRDLPCTSSEICAIDVRAGVCMTGGLWKPSGQAADHGPWSRSGKLQHGNSSVGWLCRLQEEARSWGAIRLRASCYKGKAGCLGMVLGFSLFGKNGFFFFRVLQKRGTWREGVSHSLTNLCLQNMPVFVSGQLNPTFVQQPSQ